MTSQIRSNAPTEIYSHQGNAAFEAELATRTAHQDAGFLMPHLRPGMELLDAGCGPGSITLGFAGAISHGRVIGIDLQPALVQQARARAAAIGLENARFEVGDLYRLPFADASFDVVFANGVLMHLRQPGRALAELRRVLRLGGIAALRDPDFGASLYAPTTPLMERWLALRVRARQHNGGDPFLSRHYRRLLLEAGFARTEGSAVVESAGSSEQTSRHAVFLKAQLHGLAGTMVGERWIDPATVDMVAAEIDAWAQRPDAFAATTWCQAVGWMRA